MKKAILKNQRGITLLSLMLALIVLAILAGVTVRNIDLGTDIRNYNYMCADIELLETKVRTYYNNNKELPIKGTAFNAKADLNGQASERDNDNYYQIDINELYNITLNYGGEKDNKDIYIINEQSQVIYYMKGVEYKGNITHIKNI